MKNLIFAGIASASRKSSQMASAGGRKDVVASCSRWIRQPSS
jgi:hypothetical protein